MKPVEEAVHALKSWLEDDAGYEYVVQLTGNRIRQYQHDGALSILLANRYSQNLQEQRNELSHEFMAYLFHTFLPQLSKWPDQVNALLSDRAGQVLRFAFKKFYWQLKDLARQKDVNPRAYLYRRLREVLDKDRQFIVHKDKRNLLSYFPASCSDDQEQNAAVFSTLHYLDWPAPPESGTGDEFLFKAKYLSGAALFFWQETVRQLDASYAVPVREPVRYLAAHYPWLNHKQPDSLINERDTRNTMSLEEQLDQISALSSISALAALFTSGLDVTSCQILLWSLEDPHVSFKEMAARLDLPNHNRVYRIYQKIISAMKLFTNNWPGPPLHDLPDEVGLAFIESVKKLAKNRCADRKVR